MVNITFGSVFFGYHDTNCCEIYYYDFVVPDGPPLNFTIYAIGNTSLFVTWKPPDVTKRNGKIVSYTVCIKQCGGVTCSKNYTTEEQHLEINHLKPATKYCVRVLASTKVGPGIYSKLKWTFSNGRELFIKIKISTYKVIYYFFIFNFSCTGTAQNSDSVFTDLFVANPLDEISVSTFKKSSLGHKQEQLQDPLSIDVV